MNTWIALFRGINVGGNNILPMAKLKKDLELLKLKNVRTYIQSGNVVFQSTAKSATTLSRKIERCVEEHCGFRPHVLLITHEGLLLAIENNPFPKAMSDPKSLSLFFLAEPAVAANLKALEDARSDTEKFKLTERVFYLYAPDGMGRSKLATKAEKHLGVVTTARNFRTVNKLLSMVE